MAIGVSRSKRLPTTIPGSGGNADPVGPVRPVLEEEPNEPTPPPRPRPPEPVPVEAEVTPVEAEVTPEETDESFRAEMAAMEEEFRRSFDPELVLNLGMDDLLELEKEVEAYRYSRIESSPGYDPATAAELVREIREKVVPGPEQKNFLEGILPSLEFWARELPEGEKATRSFRETFLTRFLGGPGVYYRPDQVPIEIDLWGKILRALGCELSEAEEVAVGKAIRRVSKLRGALSRLFSRARHPPERLGELGPNAIGTHRFGLLLDLETREAEPLWLEFQKALAENLSPSNLERAARLFRAFGVWTDD